MGNTKSSSSTSADGCLRRSNDDKNTANEAPLAMMAVGRKMFLKKVHILLLRYSMAKLSDDFGMIQRQGFDQALVKAKLSKIEIFDLLFTMWDNAEDGKVSYKEFCMGISPLACPSEDLSVILEFALRVSDDINRKAIERKELHELLTGINSTASYFGDKHLQPVELDRVVEAVFDDNEIISHKDCIKLLLLNPYVKRFASGKARINLRFRDVLETLRVFDKEKMVTEYIDDDDIDTLLTSKCDNEKENIPQSVESLSPKKEQTDEALSPKREDRNLAAPMTNNDFIDVPLSDKIETRDENSGVHSNSMPTNNTCRDPPPVYKTIEPKNSIFANDGGQDPPSIGKLSIHESNETSFSTYYPSTIITPSTPRDPPPTTRHGSSSLHSFGNAHKVPQRSTYH